MKPPKVGEIVEITWIDSGHDYSGKGGEGREPLTVAKAYGRVSFMGPVPKLHKQVCTQRTCRCLTVELIYDGGGDDDDRKSLGLIWWPAVIGLVKLGPKKRG